MRILGLDHVQLAMPPGGEELARAFYSNTLGLVELPKPAALAGRGGVWFRCGSLELHLGVEKTFQAAKKAHPALRVNDLDALLERLRSDGRGIHIDTSIPDVDRAFTEDPFGNRIELIDSNDQS